LGPRRGRRLAGTASQRGELGLLRGDEIP
jgi:hypothetical protein